MLTPDERLDARRTPPGVQVDDRLVVDDDLVALERALEVADHPRSIVRDRHRRLLARIALRRVHLAVGLREEVERLEPVLREERPADRGVDLDVPALDAVRAPERLPQATDERRCLLVLLRVPSERTTNSSPPTRATVSVARTTDSSRRAMVRSTWSPAS